MKKNEKFISRREFIEKSSLSVAVVSAVGPARLFDKKINFLDLSQNKMITRSLGNTGLKLPIVSFGVMNADNPNVVQHAIDRGIKLLDTAWSYQRGRNEEMIGNVLKKNKKRKDIIIVSKVPHPAIRKRNNKKVSKLADSRAIKKEFIDKFNQSLRRLQTDYIDILCQHKAVTRDLVNSEPIMEALSQLKKEGKIRFTAFSTHSNQDVVIDEAIKSKFYEVIVVALNYRTRKRKEIKDAIARAVKAGIGIIAMKTQAGGYLDRREARRKRIKPTKPVNHKACLKWVLQDKNITTAIPGCTTFEQIDELLEVAYNLELTDKEKRFIETTENMSGEFNCQGCGKCRETCPKNVDIPSIMRTYMYTFAYNNLEHAHITYEDIPEEFNLSNCDDCEEKCAVKCVNGLNVSSDLSIMRYVFKNIA